MKIEYEVKRTAVGHYYGIYYYGYYTGLWDYNPEELRKIVKTPNSRLLDSIEEIKKYPSFTKVHQ